MEQKHLQVRQCLILSFLDVVFWNEHTMIKDQTYQMFYNINYSDLCLLISKNQSMTTFLSKRN